LSKGVVKPTGPTDEQIRLLLVLYRCPVPFHIVRTRFLGSIASPELGVSPIETVKSLWGKDLSELKSVASLNELVDALVKGLWNRLARHQQRKVLFRLLRFDVPLDREGLGRLALIRHEELKGFVEGLFGPKEELDLPDRAYRALDQLSQICEFLRTVQDAHSHPLECATQMEITNTLGTLGTLTRFAEHEMHEAVLSCARARRAMPRALTARKTTLH
jgi:hypothetical protein